MSAVMDPTASSVVPSGSSDPESPLGATNGARPLVLILGGTTEGYALAERMAALSWVRPLSSLAGRTASPRRPAGAVRIGGFGGAEGLAAWLAAEGVAAVVDATHPFAARMGWNAAQACAVVGCPLLRLARPAWTPGPGDAWHLVDDWPQAVAVLQDLAARRVLLALGRQDLAPFAGLTSAWFLIRSVEAPDPLPPFAAAEVLCARGPFSLAEETALLRDHRIDALVCKNSGGTATDAKLAAARALGVRVVMRNRPPRPQTETVATVAAALDWLAPRLEGRGPGGCG